MDLASCVYVFIHTCAYVFIIPSAEDMNLRGRRDNRGGAGERTRGK